MNLLPFNKLTSPHYHHHSLFVSNLLPDGVIFYIISITPTTRPSCHNTISGPRRLSYQSAPRYHLGHNRTRSYLDIAILPI